MNTFPGTYGSEPMLAAVATQIDSIQLMDEEMAVHTVTLVLNGQHGEFDLRIEATQMEEMEEHAWTGIAFRAGGVMDLKEVDR